jgi:hypothetical protein
MTDPTVRLDNDADALTTLSRTCYAAAQSFIPLAAIRAAAGHCGRAASNLAATMEPVDRREDPERRHPWSEAA